MTQDEIYNQVEQDFEEDLMWEDPEEDGEPLGYYCLGCGNIQDKSTGFGCDVCTGQCLEPWFG